MSNVPNYTNSCTTTCSVHTFFAGVTTNLFFFGFTCRTSFPTGGFPFPVSLCWLFFKPVFSAVIGLGLLATDLWVGEARQDGSN